MRKIFFHVVALTMLSATNLMAAPLQDGQQLQVNSQAAKLTVHLPKNANGTAVLLLGEDAMRSPTVAGEKVLVRQKLTGQGFTVFDLEHPAVKPHQVRNDLADCQQAVQLIRGLAAENGAAVGKVGVVGLPSGRKAALELAIRPAATGEPVIGRPDFLAVIFPRVVAKLEPRGDVKPAVLDSNNAPPTFIVAVDAVSQDQRNGALALYRSLKSAKVSTEIHMFDQDKVGLLGGATNRWPQLFSAWASGVDKAN